MYGVIRKPCQLFFFPFFLAIKRKIVCILAITYRSKNGTMRSSLLIACEFYNLICYRRVWQLEMHLLNFCNRHCDLLVLCHNKLIEKTQTTMLHIH